MYFPTGRWSKEMNIWKDIINKAVKKEPESKKPSSSENKTGLICPRCKQTRMEYDGLLNLGCKACGYEIAGSYT